ncbi:MAG: hypothetical protein IKR73_00515, partial [Oscillospiraceae bacterium]|nr:hypothetical protein [Oscillospiraceae bacterium]
MKGKTIKRIAAVAVALTMSVGVPVTPFHGILYDTAITASAEGTTVDLSETYDYTAQDGDVLTGSTSYTVMISDGAKITLSDATINGGIRCEGTAEITLVGTNSVTTTKWGYAGIQTSSDSTLTINGEGTLTATGYVSGAGIGGGNNDSGGTIIIN